MINQQTHIYKYVQQHYYYYYVIEHTYLQMCNCWLITQAYCRLVPYCLYYRPIQQPEADLKIPTFGDKSYCYTKTAHIFFPYVVHTWAYS